jgi:hypothetical protein
MIGYRLWVDVSTNYVDVKTNYDDEDIDKWVT